jgi:chemotaxis protein MotB
MWMTTFSDMATLLMALFAMLIAFTEMQKKESMMAMEGDGRINRGVQNEIESNDMPSGRELNSATGNSDTNEGYDAVVEALSKEIEDGTVKVAIENERIVVRVDSPDSPSLDTSKVQQEQLEVYLKIAQAQDTINVDVKVEQESDGVIADSEVWEAMFSSQYREIREKLTGAIENNSAEVVREGDKIIIRLASEGSFKSGAAELRQGFEGLLTEVGAAIQDVDGLITIEGHTDNLPIGFSMRFKSNWDLSAARSGAVADYLIGQYSFGTGLMVSGLADTRPLTTNNTPEGRARNRRIEVVIDGAY